MRSRPSVLMCCLTRLAIVTLSLTMACGQPAGGSSPTVVPSSTSSPSAEATANAGWKLYPDPRWGYSLRYPEDWFSLENFGHFGTHKYFANEQVGAPLELDQMGIWLTVAVADGPCPPAPTPAPGQRELMVGGQIVTRSSGQLAPPAGEGGWTIGADVPGGGRCFEFRYIAMSQVVRDANLGIADQMIASLKLS